MQEHEREQLEQWHHANAFDKIIHYVDLLKEPTLEHIGKKISALNNLRRFYEAIDVLESIREQAENTALWHYRYAYSCMQIEQYAKAEQHLLAALAIDETNGDVWYLLALLYQDFLPNSERAQWANEQLQKYDCHVEALVHDDFVTGQRFNKAYQLFADLNNVPAELKEQLQYHFTKTITALETVVTTNQHIPQLTIGLAKTIDSLLENDKQASMTLHHVLMTEWLYILYWFGIDEETTEQSMQLFDYVLTRSDNMLSVEQVYLFQEWYKQGEYQKILDVIDAIPLTARTPDLLDWQIYVLDSQGHYTELVSLLDKTVQLYPHNNVFRVLYADALCHLNEYRLAQQHLDYVLATDAENVMALTLLLGIYRETDADEEKIHYIEQLLEKYEQGE